MNICTTNCESRDIDFAALAAEFLTERHLLEQSSKDLEDQFKNGLSVLMLLGNRVVAHATLWHLIENCYELGSVWVCGSQRGKGIATTLYEMLFTEHGEKDILITTTNPRAMRVGQKAGAVAIYRRELPLEIWQASCVCSPSKTGGCAGTCALAFGECSLTLHSSCLFAVSPETALRYSLTGIGISV